MHFCFVGLTEHRFGEWLWVIIIDNPPYHLLVCPTPIHYSASYCTCKRCTMYIISSPHAQMSLCIPFFQLTLFSSRAELLVIEASYEVSMSICMISNWTPLLTLGWPKAKEGSASQRSDVFKLRALIAFAQGWMDSSLQQLLHTCLWSIIIHFSTFAPHLAGMTLSVHCYMPGC